MRGGRGVSVGVENGHLCLPIADSSVAVSEETDGSQVLEFCGLTSAVSTLSCDLLTPPLPYVGQLKDLGRARSRYWDQR